MLGIFAAVIIMAAIVYAAFRIVLGWVLPKQTMAAIDSAIFSFLKFVFQLSIVMIGGFIVWALWNGSRGS